MDVLNRPFSRRRMLVGSALAALTATVAACGGGSGGGSGGSGGLRVSWWGSVDRAKKYDAIFAAWQKANPTAPVTGEYADWAPYWDRFATQSVGGNLPDVVSMTERQITVYNDSLVDLRPYVDDKRLDLTAYDKLYIDAGVVHDKLTMLCIGATIPALVYNTALLDKAGVTYPDQWTLDQYRDAALKLKTAGGLEWGANDDGDKPLGFDTFLRQKGKLLFSEQGLGFEEADWVEWLTFWDEMRKAGAVPPAGVTAESAAAPFQDTLIAKSRVAMTWINHNQMLTIQKYIQGQANLALQPVRDGGRPAALLAGTYFSVPQSTQNTDEAVKFIDFFINDDDAIIAYSAEFGALPSSHGNEVLGPKLDAPGKRAADFAEAAKPYGVVSGPRNPGALQAEGFVATSNQDVANGKETPDSAARKYFDQASSLMS
jgi:multiple sugar transport system substrate-binding protein